jgi:signal transduction histidine kinase
MGIDKNDLAHIFKPFYRTKNKESLLNNPSGNGLGLSISRNIALGLKGDLAV